MSALISKNTIFIDCRYLHKDLYDIVFKLCKILEEKNILLFAALRPRLNQILIYIRDRLSVCDYAPEASVILNDQAEYYVQGQASTPSIPTMANKLLDAFKTNLDGTLNQNEVILKAPVYTELTSNTMMMSI